MITATPVLSGIIGCTDKYVSISILQDPGLTKIAYIFTDCFRIKSGTKIANIGNMKIYMRIAFRIKQV